MNQEKMPRKDKETNKNMTNHAYFTICNRYVK